MLGIFLVLILCAANLKTLQKNATDDEKYFEFAHFWTSTGFCPAADIENQKDISSVLLSDTIQINLKHISALPYGAISHIRIHWLLQLIKFVQYTQAGVPIYDFTDLDTFLMNLDDLNLYPVIEFMANPGNIFTENPNRNDVLWEDFTYKVIKHYLNILGAKKVLQWGFETWNEPDVLNYNRLNFTTQEYLSYVGALRRGVTAAGRRSVNSLNFTLRGPAGLFQSYARHQLCWTILEVCHLNIKHCPLDVLTYHAKGDGTAASVMETSRMKLKNIYYQFPNLKKLPISNDEADPISNWSTERDFQADVRYAATLVTIILKHWSAKLERQEFAHLESISHDNAFLSYHPHEFSQRTLLAHFRMNNTQPKHSQFIQKPVYSALGFLAKLGNKATNLLTITAPNEAQVCLLKTTLADQVPFLSWLLLPEENSKAFDEFVLKQKLPFDVLNKNEYAYIIELLEQHNTDPAYVWQTHNSPSYPNEIIREAMRKSQVPALHAIGFLEEAVLEINIGILQQPWIILFRVCSHAMPALKEPQKLLLTQITQGEVLLTWSELPYSTQCLKSYEVWFQVYDLDHNKTDWSYISKDWHLPFPSFQFAPTNGVVDGFYKARAVDIFEKRSEFSDIVEYIEL